MKMGRVYLPIIRRPLSPITLSDVGPGEDIVCATREGGKRDERTGMNGPLVYQLFRQEDRWVAMSGRDKR